MESLEFYPCYKRASGSGHFIKVFGNKTLFDQYEFIKNRYDECIEISWIHIFISLMHSKNTSNKITMGDKPNGCHYKLNDKLFEFITSYINKESIWLI